MVVGDAQLAAHRLGVGVVAAVPVPIEVEACVVLEGMPASTGRSGFIALIATRPPLFFGHPTI